MKIIDFNIKKVDYEKIVISFNYINENGNKKRKNLWFGAESKNMILKNYSEYNDKKELEIIKNKVKSIFGEYDDIEKFYIKALREAINEDFSKLDSEMLLENSNRYHFVIKENGEIKYKFSINKKNSNDDSKEVIYIHKELKGYNVKIKIKNSNIEKEFFNKIKEKSYNSKTFRYKKLFNLL